MTDTDALVKELREHASSPVHSWEDWAQTAETLMTDAADRIEALTAENAELLAQREAWEETRKAVATLNNENGQLRTENAALKTEVAIT